LVCVDGPAGSGKTTLAAALASLVPDATVVHLDDLLDGWGGLSGVNERLDPLLLPLSRDEPGRYERYDWHAERFSDWVRVPTTPLLVVEGVGSGARRHAALCTTLVWVEVDDDLRLRRGLVRDGEAARPHWERWMVQERAHFVDEQTRERADVVV
ncbi:4-amino-4-deoxy-L-arabinose transferase, partial [Nocardioides sp.]|uniref:4-amino-4-deoxy-L-arabinose transferase n=1 Tax=Nocardioides sp. TaxID=35761 RepID=UPI002B27900A